MCIQEKQKRAGNVPWNQEGDGGPEQTHQGESGELGDGGWRLSYEGRLKRRRTKTVFVRNLWAGSTTNAISGLLAPQKSPSRETSVYPIISRTSNRGGREIASEHRPSIATTLGGFNGKGRTRGSANLGGREKKWKDGGGGGRGTSLFPGGLEGTHAAEGSIRFQGSMTPQEDGIR